MRTTYVFTLLILAAIMQSCSEKAGKQTVTIDQNQPKLQPFKLAIVTAAQPSFTITLPGELRPFEEVNIYPKIKGFVRRIYVDRGSYVHKGQLLAQLEAPEVGAQFAARNSYTNSAYQKFLFSRQSYLRLKDASRKNGAVATIELERSYAQYLGDSAAYSSSRSEASASGQMQNYLRIVAPFSGIITSRNISEGALVGDNGSNGEPLFQLTQQNKLRLVVAVPEKQAQALMPGAKITFTLIDYPGKTFTAILSRNSGALDTRTKSLLAEFDVENDNGLLRSGQYAKASLQLQRHQPTLWVPATSVVTAQSGVFVVKNEKGLTKRVPVQTGVTIDTLTEVFGNLNAGEEVLLKGSEEVKEGIKIGKQ